MDDTRRFEEDKRCGILTCGHYAGGLCVGCENADECEFVEEACTQD